MTGPPSDPPCSPSSRPAPLPALAGSAAGLQFQELRSLLRIAPLLRTTRSHSWCDGDNGERQHDLHNSFGLHILTPDPSHKGDNILPYSVQWWNPCSTPVASISCSPVLRLSLLYILYTLFYYQRRRLEFHNESGTLRVLNIARTLFNNTSFSDQR